MNEQTKKGRTQNDKEQASAELVDVDLDQAAGGGVNDPIGGVGIGLGKKPNQGSNIGKFTSGGGAA